ncbi:hypothetical protein [Anaerocellum diazotrophicum]|uniref:Uncharacterized protein n=1 Tax=Caldicellulosiruptor diazotrophicus TaxID=2806205 RepID=A0ABM7NLC4_9FIRM|nr:hypothetical protein [Caldicellulosiruptor diazotrophicus]BCS80918.1 hypothetical protein CaldiYA01_08780 [Caldicellulosiruptor diazotrophicus]
MKKGDSFILDFWEKIFLFFQKISLFYWIKKITKNKSYFLVDMWVLGHLVLAFVSTLITYYIGAKCRVIIWIVITYAILRVFEIIVYQFNVLFFDNYRNKKKGEPYKIKSATRMVILLLHNYFEVMMWYSALMISILLLNGNFTKQKSWWDYIRANVLNVATFNSDDIQNITGEFTSVLSNFVFLENMTGLIMTIICLARFINLLPNVEREDD